MVIAEKVNIYYNSEVWKEKTTKSKAGHTIQKAATFPHRYLSAISHPPSVSHSHWGHSGREQKEHKWNHEKENLQRQFERLHFRRENICHGSGDSGGVHKEEWARKSPNLQPPTQKRRRQIWEWSDAAAVNSSGGAAPCCKQNFQIWMVCSYVWLHAHV